MTGTIRSIGQNNASATGSPLAKRGVHRLSDGSLIAVVADSCIPGNGSSPSISDSRARMFIYSSADQGVSWTLLSTILLNSTLDYIQYSSAIDASDNLHITWTDYTAYPITNSTLRAVYYQKFTFASGPTYTAGAIVTMQTYTDRSGSSPGWVAYRVDIDTFGRGSTSQAAIAVCEVYAYGGVGGNTQLGLYITNAAATAKLYGYNASVDVTAPDLNYDADITVSCAHDAVVGNIGTWTVIMPTMCKTNDIGDAFYWGQVNLSSGALVGTINNTRIYQIVGINRRYMLFCADGSRTFVYGIQSTGSGSSYGYKRFSISTVNDLTEIASANLSMNQSFVPVIPGAQTSIGGGLFSSGYYTNSMMYDDDTTGNLTFIFISSSGLSVFNVTANTFAGSGRTNPTYWDQPLNAPTRYGASCVTGGKNRNFVKGQMDSIIHYSNRDYVVNYLDSYQPSAPAGITPAAGSTITTDLPVVSANYKMPYYSTQGNVYITWVFATNSALTTNVHTFVSPNSVAPVGTDPVTGATVTDTEVLDALHQLRQGTWYVGAFETDEWGQTGPMSAVNSFTLSHPPAAANLSPAGTQVVIYGSGVIQFIWTFTDPSPVDYQTAYQVQIQKSVISGTSTVITAISDTSKVSSTSSVANIALSAANRNVENLQWRVRLWDRDDVAGNWSNWASFIASDPPSVAITFPTNNSVLTSSTPTVTFSNGLSAPKIQKARRIVITKSDNSIVYDNTASTNSTSVAVPPGVLHNLNNYSIQVIVVDNYGLQGSSPGVVVGTTWATPPVPVSVRAFTYRYATDGYIFIGWDAINIATGFVSWNLYRRENGSTNWVLIESVSGVDTTYGYRDFSVRSGRTYQYAVTQVANTSGDLVEAIPVTMAQVVVPPTIYWIVDPLGVVETVPLYAVTADKYTIEQETAVMTIVGAGRHVDEGDILGATGSLTCNLRDKSEGLAPSVNSFMNSGFQSNSITGTPDAWTLSAKGSYGTLSNTYMTFYEPAPNGALSNLVFRSSGLANSGSDALTLSQSVTLARMPVAPGKTFDVSLWGAPEPKLGAYAGQPSNVKVVIQYYNAGSTLITTQTIAANVVDSYEPLSSGDLSVGSWKRYKASTTMPLFADHMVVTFEVYITTAGSYGFILGGAQLEPKLTPYFDGDMRSAGWSGAQYLSTSFTNGYYTASNQKSDIQAIKNLGRPLFLKTPFGDNLYVKFGDNDFDRLAGTTAEFGQLTLPYMEVAF